MPTAAAAAVDEPTPEPPVVDAAPPDLENPTDGLPESTVGPEAPTPAPVVLDEPNDAAIDPDSPEEPPLPTEEGSAVLITNPAPAAAAPETAEPTPASVVVDPVDAPAPEIEGGLEETTAAALIQPITGTQPEVAVTDPPAESVVTETSPLTEEPAIAVETEPDVASVVESTEPDGGEAPAEVATEVVAQGFDVAAGVPVNGLPAEVAGAGGLAINPSGEVAFGGGGAVSITGGGAVVAGLQGVTDPIWSPNGDLLLVATTANGVSFPTAALWDPFTGNLQVIADPATDLPYRDLPAGWSARLAFYQRVFLDGSGVVELHGTLGGGGDSLRWSGDAGGLFGEAVSAIRVSPDGASIAYASAGQLLIAAVNDPTNPFLQIPGGSGVGFDWSPSGYSVVVSDGFALSVYDAFGGDLITASANSAGAPIGPPRWGPDGIYFVRLDVPMVQLLPTEVVGVA